MPVAARRLVAPVVRKAARPRPAVEPLEPRRLLSAAGDLDPTFAAGGPRTFQALGALVVIAGVAAAAAADGKVLVALNVAAAQGQPALPAVARLAADGTLDPAFGGDGVVEIPGGFGLGVRATPDGGTLVQTTSGLVRLRADGALDPAFGGGDGVADCPTSAVGIGAVAGAFEVAGDGRIYLAGQQVTAGDGPDAGYHYGLARLRPDGSPDPSFGGGDGVYVGPPGLVTALAVGPDGSAVLVGRRDGVPAGGPDLRAVGVARVTAAGAADRAFGGGDGFVEQALDGVSAAGDSVAVDAGGRVLVGAHAFVYLDGVGGEARGVNRTFRLKPNGSLDRTFDELPFGTGAVRVLPTAGGKVMLVGSGLGDDLPPRLGPSVPGPFRGAFAARFTAAGRLDPTFAGLGFVPVIDNFLAPGEPAAAALAPDGRLLVAGQPRTSLTLDDYFAVKTAAVTRVLTAADGGPDASGLALSADGTLRFAASALDDFLQVRAIIDPAHGDRVWVTANRSQRVYPRSAVRRVVSDLGYGHDAAFVQAWGIPADLRGGPGDDFFSTGTGADTLDGGDGRDRLDGDEGIGGYGTPAARGPLLVPDPTPGKLRSADVLTGGDGDDTLLAGPGNDRLDGGAGDDDLDAGTGNDTLRGGDGNDICDGGAGDDWVDGGFGADQMNGYDSPRDTLSYAGRTAGVFVDLLADHYHGGEPGEGDHAYGFAVVVGGAGNDVLRGTDGVGETLLGNGGDDILVGRGGNDTLVGGAGRDRLYGQAGDDRLFGDFQAPAPAGGFADFVQGNNGSDRARRDPKDEVLGVEGLLP